MSNKDLLKFEKELFDRGIRHVAGIDEVGRGPLAGPFVVAAVILNIQNILNLDDEASPYHKIRDSKKVTPRNREYLSEFIINNALSYSIIEVSHTELDKQGISKITQYAFEKSMQNLKIVPDHVITDAIEIKNLSENHQTNLRGGDDLSINVAAASIIAKVYRDTIMIKLHEKYPQYGFHKHKGYGTKAHIEALYKHGPCPIHRRSFEPLKSITFKI